FFAASRRVSADLATVIRERLTPDDATIRRGVEVAPNGIHLFLPPAGGTEMREMWLRDRDRFEVYLSIIDLLRDQYDLVIVDSARAEGVLPFALAVRATERMLVTSSDVGSVHLLSADLGAFLELPGSGKTRVIVSHGRRDGLTARDVADYLIESGTETRWVPEIASLPFDARGRCWVGTRNSIYTEGGKATRIVLDALAARCLKEEELGQPTTLDARTRFERIRELMFSSPSRRLEAERRPVPMLALPNPQEVTTDSLASAEIQDADTPLFEEPQRIPVGG
ncbi:MAG: hypothetical protein KDD44_13945, partial [Bdellovibrionales bacterium]|nr:hypothetical protein [Bdellovibrionales bacterium]